MNETAAREAAVDNPLLQEWSTPFDLPPFACIQPEHFRPAFDLALANQRATIDKIAANSATPTFDNTIAEIERSWRELSRVSAVFHLLSGAHTSDALDAIDLELSPVLSRHYSEIYQHEGLYARLDALYRQVERLGLSEEQRRVLWRYHTDFTRAGAALSHGARERLKAIGERLATLGTQFSQNVLTDEKEPALVLDEADLAGLPDFVRNAALAEGEERGLPGKYVITVSRSSVTPFLQFSARRDLREKAFKAWIARGDGDGTTDNKALIAEMVALRAERAALLGYESFAEYRIADSMAKTPVAARKLLDTVWQRARVRALEERDGLAALAAQEGINEKIAPWDWRYYADKVRKADHDLDEAEIKPFLQLDKMIEAAFYVATRLFGLTFAPRSDLPVYHPDVRAWEVLDRDGRHVGVFLGDYFARPSKHSGAWMTSLRDQERLDGEVSPVIINVMNFTKGAADEPALLSFDDAHTLFHEFGHGLHGLLSNVTYPLLSGTSVNTDFVEFPSQLYEHWLEQPEVLSRFAVHYRTGEAMPQPLVARVLAAKNFGMGFGTVEYVSSAIVDLDFHSPGLAQHIDATTFERESLARIGMPEEIVMRHRPPHFTHIFAGGGYAAGYYSYMWSEMLDADGFAAFKEAGDIFDPAIARRLHDYVYSAGNIRDPAEAYRLFRGDMPNPQAVIEKRGLA